MLLLLPAWNQAQFLAWDFENVVTDVKESGVNPDMVIDAAGTIHISYWQREEDKLIYAFQTLGSNTWVREYVDATGQNGYVSAIALDATGTPHIAYQENVAFVAQVRFASRTGTNSWTIERIPGDPVRGWGGYGPNASITEKERVVHSIDLVFDESNDPQIAFFDGWMDIDAFPACTQNSEYGFQLHQAFKLNGIWKERSMGKVSDQNLSCGTGASPDTLPSGDRYGEYVNLMQRSDGRLEIFCMSRFNNRLINFQNLFQTVDTVWSYQEIDSLNRILGPNWSWSRRWFTVEGVAAEYGSDDVTHLAYTTSLFYGENFCCTTISNDLIYTRIEADTTIHHNFGVSSYRNHVGLTTKGTDSVFFAYVDLTNYQFLLQASADSGKTWVMDTIMNGIGISQIRLDILNDSLHALMYNSETENLVMGRRHVNGGPWTFENVTNSQNKGQVIDSKVVPINGDTAAHIAYTDRIQDQLFYAYGTESTGWNWNIETLNDSIGGFKAVSFAEASGHTPVIVYAGGDAGDLRMAAKINGNWRYEIVDTATATGFTDIEISALDSVHIAYYDDNANCLKYAVRHLSGSTWSYDAIDCANQPVGQYPSMKLDAQGEPHVAYYDASRLSLMYASKDATTRAWNIDSVNSNTASGMGKFSALRFGTDGLPKIAYLDEQATAIWISEKNLAGSWNHQLVDSAAITNIGRPIRMEIDQFGRPWIAYNYYTNFDKVKLVRRDVDGSLNEVAVSSAGRIANAFNFQILGQDLFIIGRKNQLGNSGVAMLLAHGGLSVAAPAPFDLNNSTVISNYPNPFSGSTTFRIDTKISQNLSLRVFDLYGKTIAQVLEQQKLGAGVHEFTFDAARLAPGVYLYELRNAESRIVKKFVIAQP